MGGDQGPAAVVAGLALSADKNPDIGFLLHGDKPTLEKLLTRTPALSGCVEVRHTEEVVTMDAKLLRHAKWARHVNVVYH